MKEGIKLWARGTFGESTDGGVFYVCGPNLRRHETWRMVPVGSVVSDWTGLQVVVSWGGGWDHVSVSKGNRETPTWEEMEQVKRFCFRPDEVAMQLHVAESDHISVHPGCLHLWRPHSLPIPLPPKEFV